MRRTLVAALVLLLAAGARAATCDGAADGTPCDDGSVFTAFDHCVAGACVGQPAVCGDGVLTPYLEECDLGADNGRPGTCCTATCTSLPYGTPCTADDDLCTQDVCGDHGVCLHEVAPRGACAVPQRPGDAVLLITANAGSRRTRVTLDWARASPPSRNELGDPATTTYQLCVYDQDGGSYRSVYRGAPLRAGRGRWRHTARGWRLSPRARRCTGIAGIAVDGPTSNRSGDVRVAARTRGAAGLPLRIRRHVVAQLRSSAGGCWGASFATPAINDALGFLAASEAPGLQDVNGNGVREWLMVGDSNTGLLPCAYPEQLQLRHPDVVVHWLGLFGSNTASWLESGRLPPLLDAYQPDAVLIALGTNDVSVGVPTVANLHTLAALVDDHRLPNGAHPMSYVATVPKAYLVPPEIAAQIAVIDADIRAGFPADRVVDFDSWMPDAWDPSVMYVPDDGVHFSCAGQARRTDVVDVITGQ